MSDKDLLHRFKRLQSIRGVTGTVEEREIAEEVYRSFAEVPYFRQHPEHLMKSEIANDVYSRFNVYAFYHNPEPCNKTIILTGHMDVVDIEGFGHLSGLAFDYKEYTKRVHELSISPSAKDDLNSGEWIFGRGVADMRFGLAMAIELLKEYTEKPDFSGNLLFLGVVGEETNSEGMRHALPFLYDLEKQYDLDYLALFLFESFLFDPEQPLQKRIHIGACGKLMPFFIVAGENHHASIPSGTIDSPMVIAEIIERMSLEDRFRMESRGKVSPPLVCLKYGDMSSGYSASTPLYGMACFNYVTLEEKAEEVITLMKTTAENVLADIVDKLNDKKIVEERRGGEVKNVVCYEEVYRKAVEKKGKYIEEGIRRLYESMSREGKSIQDIGLAIVHWVYEQSEISKPAVIIGFLPPYYVTKFPDESEQKTKHVLNLIEELSEYADYTFGETLVKDDYYMGVSDLSFVYGLDGISVTRVTKNIPGCDLLYMVPDTVMQKLKVPGVVIGTYGKDFHTPTERLHLGYSLKVVPELHRYAIDHLMRK